MSDVRDEILALLPRLWKLHPDMRFGQLVTNVSYWARRPEKSATWDVEDAEFLQAMKKHIEEREQEPRGS